MKPRADISDEEITNDIISWRFKLAAFVARFGHGKSLTSMVTSAIGSGMLAATMIGVYQDQLEFLPFKPIYLVFIGVPGMMAFWYIIGWMDEKWGFWKHQAVFGIRNVSPPTNEMLENIRTIKELLEKDDE